MAPEVYFEQKIKLTVMRMISWGRHCDRMGKIWNLGYPSIRVEKIKTRMRSYIWAGGYRLRCVGLDDFQGAHFAGLKSC